MKTPNEWLEELRNEPRTGEPQILAFIERIQKDAYIQGGLDAIEKAQSITSEVFAKHKEAA